MDPRSFFCGTQFAKRESIAPLARYAVRFYMFLPLLRSALRFVSSLRRFSARWGVETDIGPNGLLRRKSGASLRQNKTSGKAETEEVSAPFW